MTAARSPCEWHKVATEHGQKYDTWYAIDPHKNPGTWQAWRDYFRWLNWAPFWFLEVERLHDMNPACPKSWTAPSKHPDDLQARFEPLRGQAPRFAMEETKRFRNAMNMWTREERHAHVERLRAAGMLKFASEFDPERKPWFQSLTKQQAQEFLDANEWKP